MALKSTYESIEDNLWDMCIGRGLGWSLGTAGAQLMRNKGQLVVEMEDKTDLYLFAWDTQPADIKRGWSFLLSLLHLTGTPQSGSPDLGVGGLPWQPHGAFE